MKYISINGREYSKEELDKDITGSEKFKNIKLGEKFLFFRKGLKTYYISYESLKCAFRRIMVVPAGKREIQVDYLVIADKRKELAVIQVAGHNIAAAVMEKLKIKAPNASFVCSDRLKR